MIGIGALIALTLLATGSRAPNPNVSGRPWGDTEPVQRRSCPLATVPGKLPDIAAIVDMDTLRRALAAELSGVSSTGPMLFSIRFTGNGQREWLERITNEAVDVQLQSRVQRVIAEHVKGQPASKDPWSLRLQVLPGDSVQLRLSHSEICPVERIADPLPVGGGSFRLDRAEMAELQRAGPVRIDVVVSATGRVLGVELLESSRSRIVDDQALKTAREGRYRPALVDGIPVAGRYEFGSRTRVRVRSR